MTVEFGVHHEGAPSSLMLTCNKQQVHRSDELGQGNRFKNKRRGQKWAVKLGDRGDWRGGENSGLGQAKSNGYWRAGRGWCRRGVAQGGVGSITLLCNRWTLCSLSSLAAQRPAIAQRLHSAMVTNVNVCYHCTIITYVDVCYHCVWHLLLFPVLLLCLVRLAPFVSFVSYCFTNKNFLYNK
jgi:hypothetical protein